MFRKGGNTTTIKSGGRIKLHTTWDDGSELIEEFDANTDELLVRRIRRKTAVGSVGEWEWLAGDPPAPSTSGTPS